MQIQRTKYALEFKDEVVKQVVVRAHSVVDVAKRLGIPESMLYTRLSKLEKTDELVSNYLKALQAEMAELKAEHRRTTEGCDTLKRPPPTSQNSLSEVRVHSSLPMRI